MKSTDEKIRIKQFKADEDAEPIAIYDDYLNSVKEERRLLKKRRRVFY